MFAFLIRFLVGFLVGLFFCAALFGIFLALLFL